MKKIPARLQPWFEARRRFKLSDAHVHMARELGMNPKKLGSTSNSDQELWKAPLPTFISRCYEKSFGRSQLDQVRSLEELIAADEVRRQRKRERKAQRVSGAAAE